jgi:cytochrome c-type biogenesis protein CcmE
MMYSSLSENCTYHLNVSEAVNIPSEKLKSARLFGVAEGDIVKPANGLGASFTMRDLENPKDTLYVQYKGALPDTFEKGAEVIVEGRMEGKVFMAKTLMTKCPSKYEKSNREKA